MRPYKGNWTAMILEQPDGCSPSDRPSDRSDEQQGEADGEGRPEQDEAALQIGGKRSSQALGEMERPFAATTTDNAAAPPGSSIIRTALKIIRLGPICDSCLGRQFARLSTGFTNQERGRTIKSFLAMAADLAGIEGQSVLKDLAPSFRPARLRLREEGEDQSCWVCLGLMEPARLGKLAASALNELERIEYGTFLVGTYMSGLLAENEELLLADGGSGQAEPMKSELNREVGKLIAARTGKAADLQSPDVVVHLNLAEGRAQLQINSLYIYGRYRKLQRGFPQTRWPCRACGGAGCQRCGNSGRMYQESVDELIRDPIIEAARAEDTVFHGSGREDIDALMLGSGRPFVVEAKKPYRRSLDYAALRDEINRRAAGKVEVSDLTAADRALVEALKEAAYEKSYSAWIELAGPVEEEKLKSVLKELVGPVEQRTPNRVSHRRADKVRVRFIHDAELNEVRERSARITIRCDSGLYVKELVSGDGGRTKPSLAAALGMDARVVELDVIDVGGVSNGQVTRDSHEYKV